MSSLLCYAVSLTYSLLGSADSGSTLGLLTPNIDARAFEKQPALIALVAALQLFCCGTDCVCVGSPVPVMIRGPALIGRLICMGITVGAT